MKAGLPEGGPALTSTSNPIVPILLGLGQVERGPVGLGDTGYHVHHEQRHWFSPVMSYQMPGGLYFSITSCVTFRPSSNAEGNPNASARLS